MDPFLPDCTHVNELNLKLNITFTKAPTYYPSYWKESQKAVIKTESCKRQ